MPNNLLPSSAIIDTVFSAPNPDVAHRDEAVPAFFRDRRPVLLCLSHLRWDFVWQRPQHLLSRAAVPYRVVFFEEPCLVADTAAPRLHLSVSPEGVLVATPHLPGTTDPDDFDTMQRDLLDGLLVDLASDVDVAWFYTPKALDFAGHVEARTTLYDCMDELTLFRGASPRLVMLERQLLRQADLVFTGGRSLHEAKRRMHADVHMFPSSVEVVHFHQARTGHSAPPPDQAGLAHPRIGFFGVIDERLDYALIEAMALARPDWQFVMLGPTAKIDPAQLPRSANLHWLGMKSYQQLPAYLAGWDVGMMPFARNEATRFISPTKTPEFLAAGIPLVSTAIADVVADWGQDGLVEIAGDAPAMIAAIERLLSRPRAPWLARVDERLSLQSWDSSWSRMRALIDAAPGAIHLQEAADVQAVSAPGIV